jgi:hypothetical protein
MKENPKLVKFKWKYDDYCLPCAQKRIKKLRKEEISVGT